MLVYRLRFALLLVLLVNVGGIVGYRVIEGWSWLDSAWMVAITLTTIGYGEPYPLSDAGRWFTLGLIASGLSVFSYALSQVTRYVLEGGLRQDLRQRHRRQEMDKLDNHFIVVGFGRLGLEVAQDIRHAGQPLVIIESQPDAQAAAEALGFTCILGDASLDDVLESAHIGQARGLAVATGQDAVNILVTLSAHGLHPDLRILTRVSSEDAATKAYRAGAAGVLSPYGLGGTHMALGLLRPEARAFLELALVRTNADLAVEDVKVGREMHTPLAELKPRHVHSVLVVAVRKKDGSLEAVPGPESIIEQGDVVVAVGKPEDLASFAATLR